MARTNSKNQEATTRSIRFAEHLRLQPVELVKNTDRTFSAMVIHAVRKALAVLEQQERDRAAGERESRSRRRKLDRREEYEMRSC